MSIYVCPACGKTAKKLKDFKDVSCYMHAIKCKEDSLVYKDGSVIKAVAESKS